MLDARGHLARRIAPGQCPIIEPAQDRRRHRSRRAALDSPDDRDPQGGHERGPLRRLRDEVQDAQLGVQVGVGQRINPEPHAARRIQREARRLSFRRVRVVANGARLVQPHGGAHRLERIHAFGAIPIVRAPALWERIGDAWEFRRIEDIDPPRRSSRRARLASETNRSRISHPSALTTSTVSQPAQHLTSTQSPLSPILMSSDGCLSSWAGHRARSVSPVRLDLSSLPWRSARMSVAVLKLLGMVGAPAPAVPSRRQVSLALETLGLTRRAFPLWTASAQITTPHPSVTRLSDST